MKIVNNTDLKQALTIDANHSAVNAKGLYLSARRVAAMDLPIQVPR
jgi:hypothetical protein